MITIPKQHYINKRRIETENIPLAFATPHGTDSAYEKRKNTVDSWVESHIPQKYDDNLKRYVRVASTPEGWIQDNTLVEGFTIGEDVRRSGRWGNGNVVWRVHDPRGYQLEIPSANLARILECTTIVDGVIQGKCCWGRDGSVNVLLPEASEPYQLATNNTKKLDGKLSTKHIKPGNKVTIRMYEEFVPCTFIGAYHFAMLVKTNEWHSGDHYHRPSYNTEKFHIETKRRFVFSRENGTYEFVSDPTIVSIEDTSVAVYDQIEISELLKEQHVGGGTCIVASNKPIKPEVVWRAYTGQDEYATIDDTRVTRRAFFQSGGRMLLACDLSGEDPVKGADGYTMRKHCTVKLFDWATRGLGNFTEASPTILSEWIEGVRTVTANTNSAKPRVTWSGTAAGRPYTSAELATFAATYSREEAFKAKSIEVAYLRLHDRDWIIRTH